MEDSPTASQKAEDSIQEPLSVDTSETDTVSIDGERPRYILGSNSSSASSPAKVSSGNTTPTSKPSPPITPSPTPPAPGSEGGSSTSSTTRPARETPASTPTSRHNRPSRPGITWRDNAKIEALDFQKKWYSARIIEIDDTDNTVLIHFDGWNHRYDEWIDMKSERLRPFTRHSDRKKEAAMLKAHLQEHKLGDNVFAKWTDCRMYAGTIVGVNSNGSYEVLFYDGFKKSVQPINVKAMSMEVQKEYASAGILPDPTKRVKQKLSMIQKEHSLEDRGKSEEHDQVSTGNVSQSSDGKISPTTTLHKEVASKLKRTIKRKSMDLAESSSKTSTPSTSPTAKKSKIVVGGNFQINRLKGRPGKQVVFKNRDRKKDLKHIFRQGDEQRKKQSQLVKHSKQSPSEKTIKSSKTMVPPSEAGDTSDEEVALAELIRQKEGIGDSWEQQQQTKHVLGSDAKKAFKVEAEHNKCKCPFDNCNKSFRKISLVEYHIKYYHAEDGRPIQPPPPPIRRRKKTLSVCSSDSEMSTSGRGHHLLAGSRRHRDPSNTSLELPSDSSRLSALEDVMLHDLSEVETLHTTTTEELDSRDARGLGEDAAGGHEDDLEDDLGMDRLNKDELVNCICQINEENGLMIQCDVCLCWQHAVCMELTEEGLPSKYVCYVCANPPGVREQGRYSYDQDWLKQGTMARFGFLPTDPFMAQKAQIMQATHSLVADVHNIQQALHSTKCQIEALKDKNHPEVKFWVKNWDRLRAGHETEENPEIKTETDIKQEIKTEIPSEIPSAVVETTVKSEPVDVELPERNTTVDPDKESETDPGNSHDETVPTSSAPPTSLPANESSSSLSSYRSLASEDGHVSTTSISTTVPVVKESEPVSVKTEEEPALSCEQRLLEHLTLTQDKVDLQLELIEDQISALESADDNGSNHSSGDVLRDLPRIKKAIHQILNDLVKVKHMSLYH